MAISIDSVGKLQEYLTGVLSRAGHHAGQVEGVAIALMGAVIWKSTGEVKVREYAGEPANIIWFWVDDKKYVLKYNHKKLKIELLKEKHNGEVVHCFDNSSSYAEIIDTFTKL